MHGKIHKVYVQGNIAFDDGEFYPRGKKINNLHSS